MGLNDKGLEEDRKQRREQERERAPLERNSARFAASAPLVHLSVILYHSRLVQTLVNIGESGFDEQSGIAAQRSSAGQELGVADR